MSVATQRTVVFCDFGGTCPASFSHREARRVREVRELAIAAGWDCRKRGQWRDLCPEHGDDLAAVARDLGQRP